jgi:hypothetical protein
MGNGEINGYAVNPVTLDEYLTNTVNPAIDSLSKILGGLYVPGPGDVEASDPVPDNHLVGTANMEGSTEFTKVCNDFLGKFFDVHGQVEAKHQELFNTLITFRDTLAQTSKLYAQTENNIANNMLQMAKKWEA